jgi:hypothetical protein
MPLVEDYFAFFGDFGVDATLDAEPVRGIFDNAYVESFGLATRQPRFALSTAEAGAVQQGGVLVIGTATYRVTAVQPDGTGMTELALELQP